MNRAKKYVEFKACRKIFDAIKRNVVVSRAETMHARDKCRTAYMKALFERWRKELVDLKEERLTVEAKQSAIVRDFRYKRFARLFLEGLERNKEEMAIEKEKNKFKQAMWSKVNTWLDDIDSKAGEEKKQ